jgi:hypothetical protein
MDQNGNADIQAELNTQPAILTTKQNTGNEIGMNIS